MPFISNNNDLVLSQTDYTTIFKFENTTARRLFVNKFDLIPDVFFANYGLARIQKNGFTIFETKDQDNQNPLANYSNYPIRQLLLFLDPHDTITIQGILLEKEESKLTISYSLDFVSDPAPDVLIPFSIAEKTIISKKQTLFPEKFYEQTLNEPHFSTIDNPNYNNLQISIEANAGYNPTIIQETQNQRPINLEKFVNAYRGNNSQLNKVGQINNQGGLMSFIYDTETERVKDLLNIERLQLKTPFILNPDSNNSVFNFNHDGSKYFSVEKNATGLRVIFKEYDLVEKFNMSENNRTLVSTREFSAITTVDTLTGLYFDITGKRFFIFYSDPLNRQWLVQRKTTVPFSVENLETPIVYFQWPFPNEKFLSVIIPNLDGCVYFLSTDPSAPTNLRTRKYSFSPSDSFSRPHLINSNFSTWTGGENYNLVNAQFSQDGKIIFILAEPKTPGTNILVTHQSGAPFRLLQTFSADFQIDFEYSKLILDFSDHTIIAKNANFSINEWFLFDIISGEGWAFYDENNNLFYPTDVTGEYIADTTTFDTNNETEQTQNYQFSLSSSNDFELDLTFSYLQSISRTHNFHYTRRPRPLPSFPQLYDIRESITNQYNFKGKRLYTQNRNVLRAFGSDTSDFADSTFLYEINNWTGEQTIIPISTDKKYIKFEKFVFYQFLIDDFSDTLEQSDSRTGRFRTRTPTLINRYSDTIEFINALGPGRELLPNRYMMYYDQVLPQSMQLYAPTFLKKVVDLIPQDSIFQFDIYSKLPLPSGNITIGLEIIGEGDNWYPLIDSIGAIKPIGRTLIQLKQFDPQTNLVLPKGKNVLRASLKSDQKIKLSVLAILS